MLDLGAGKFDAAVIAITGDDLEVIAASGDALLGGFELDALALTSLEPRAREARRTALEADRPADAPDAKPTPEVVGLVERALAVGREALASARVTPADLDELLLVGGPAKARPFTQAFEALLGRPARTDLHPTHAVAFGAALAGHALVLKERGKPTFSTSEVLCTTLSAGLRGGALRPILERNTRLPAEKTLAIPIPDLQPVVLPIFQGATLLGTLTTRGEKPGELSVRFALSADGRLTITAIGQSSRKGQGTFSPADPGPSRSALLDKSPLLPQQAPTDKGLLKGLKRLFGR